MLYRPEAFEALTPARWRKGRVHDAIAAIVADVDDAFDDDALWPADEWDGWQTPLPLKNLYVGAAGVVWALGALRDRGFAPSRLDLSSVAWRTLQARRARPDLMIGIELPEPAQASRLEGETGILTVLWLQEPDGAVADELHQLVHANVDNAADELMWGSPGTMLVARAMLEWTGEDRWAEAWRLSAAALLDRRDEDGLWSQRLYGETNRNLGPIHGAVGNVLALLRGGELLAEENRSALMRETATVLARTAVVEGGRANWPGARGRLWRRATARSASSGIRALRASSLPPRPISRRSFCTPARSSSGRRGRTTRRRARGSATAPPETATHC